MEQCVSGVYQFCNRQHTFTMSSHSLEVYQPCERQRTVLILCNMTLKSHCTHQGMPTGSLWNSTQCTRQHNTKPQHIYLITTHPMDQRRPKPHRFHSCLMFRFKDRVRMDQRSCGGDVQGENTESRLRELALKWFTETQAPLILHNGNFPEWFQGFISRKEAEEHLKDKTLGCFLIRLSDKATGYILSYKGCDRCRHFVINQNKDGHFIVTGDTEKHDSLTSLIEYYKTRPIEPFGEYLTNSCCESSTSELYDVIHVDLREKPGVSVKAVKDIWNQQGEISQPPALPPKSNRNMQAVPAVLRKGPPPKTPSQETNHTSENVLYTQVDLPKPKERARSPIEGGDFSQTAFRVNQGGEPKGPRLQKSQGTVYSELVVPNCRSQSLPLLDDDTVADKNSYSRNQSQLNTSSTNRLPGLSTSLDKLCNTSLYHLAGTSGNQSMVGKRASKVSTDDVTYAEVLAEHVPNHFCIDNTYEQIPDSRPTATVENNMTHTNTYETLTDLKPKQNNSARAVKAEKWKWLSPEYWKK